MPSGHEAPNEQRTTSAVPTWFLEDQWHRAEIEDALRRYCRGLDRCNWTLLRSAYHPDAHDDHGTYKGDIDGLVDWAAERHAHIEQSMHLLGNCTIERVGDIAVVETYCVAHLRFNSAETSASAMYGDGVDGELVSATWWLRYLDRFERRPDWRVANRVVVLDHVRTDVADPSPVDDDVWTHSRRDGEDALWTMRADLELGTGSLH